VKSFGFAVFLFLLNADLQKQCPEKLPKQESKYLLNFKESSFVTFSCAANALY